MSTKLPRLPGPPKVHTPASLPPEAVGQLLADVANAGRKVGALETKVTELESAVSSMRAGQAALAASVQNSFGTLNDSIRDLTKEVMRSKDVDREQMKSLSEVQLEARTTAKEVESMAKSSGLKAGAGSAAAVAAVVELAREVIGWIAK